MNSYVMDLKAQMIQQASENECKKKKPSEKRNDLKIRPRFLKEVYLIFK